jgi:hypothetical protein
VFWGACHVLAVAGSCLAWSGLLNLAQGQVNVIITFSRPSARGLYTVQAYTTISYL